MRYHKIAYFILLFCCACGFGLHIHAANYPEKPLNVIVPAGAGGDTDISARIISKYVQKYIGKPIIITNVAGAGGVLGSRQVKDSEPDGYTILFHHYGSLALSLMKKADFYILDDFEVNGIPLMDNTTVIICPNDRYKDMAELIEDAKGRPGEIRYGIETGTVAHLFTYIIQDLTGVQFNAIDTGTAATKNAALLSGQADLSSATYMAVKSFVDSGDFSLLGILADHRNPGLPDVKTMKEQGINLSVPKFFYFAFPKGTPEHVMQIFNEAVKKACSDPDAKAELEKFYMTLGFIEKEEAHEIIEATKEMFAEHINKIM